MVGKASPKKKRYAILLAESFSTGEKPVPPWVLSHNLSRTEAELLVKVFKGQNRIVHQYEYDFAHAAPKPENCADCAEIVLQHCNIMLGLGEQEAANRGLQILKESAQTGFEALLDVLPPAQRRLWTELRATPRGFVLYGGTAIALRLGHRHSEDFDFFSNGPFSPQGLKNNVGYLKDAETIQSTTNTLTCIVHRGGPVQVSFFGGLDLNRVAEPQLVTGIWVASMLDLLAVKLGVLVERAAYKDYMDIDALLGAGVDLAEGLGAGQAVYGPQFNPFLSLKALTFFGEGDLHRVDPATRARLTKAAENVNPRKLPAVVPRRGLLPK